MRERLGIKYHKQNLLEINNLYNQQNGILSSKDPTLNGSKASLEIIKKSFTIGFEYDLFSNDLDVGDSLKNTSFKTSSKELILESIYLNTHSTGQFKGRVSKIHSKGFSKKRKFYYRVIIPLVKELQFIYNIEQTSFETDLGYSTRNSTRAQIDNDTIDVCCIHQDKKNHYLVIDSNIKQSFEDFSTKANSVKIGLGYLTGYYVGDMGFFFAYSDKIKKENIHFYFRELRNSIIAGYTPVYSNSYGYLNNNRRLAEKYSKNLRQVSLNEFSNLCQKINDSLNFASALMLIIESSVASLLFMPGGFAIALETLSDLIKGNKKIKISPITDKTIRKKVVDECTNIINKYCNDLEEDAYKALINRITNLNQTTNKARLRAPFDFLDIDLLPEDVKILETRNDFLHGRTPDLTNVGLTRDTDRINKDIYYASMRLYTLLNILILKWIGYDNRVVNYPFIHQPTTKIKIKEEPYRQV